MGKYPHMHLLKSSLTVTTGYNMAKNLQSNLPSTDILLVQDINTEATKRFLEDVKSASRGAMVKVAASVREVSEDSVGLFIP